MKKTLIMLFAACLLLVSCTTGSPVSDESSSPAEQSEHASESASQDVSDDVSDNVSADDSSEDESEQSTVQVIGIDDGKFVYYAFGDSIAYGYALDYPSTMCYGALFASHFDGIQYENYAVSGHKTSDMLNVLDSVDVSDADLITISIGANNLLGYAIEATNGVLETYGDGIFNDYVSALMGIGDKDRVVNFIKDVEYAFTNEDFQAKAQAGLDKLNEELPQIFQKIQDQNDKCVIIIQTVYNPYKGIAIGLPGEYSFDLSAACDGYIKTFNDAIISVAEEYGCEVLDVYTDFENSDSDLINAGIVVTPSMSFNYDPHPNAAGHIEIADILYTEWMGIIDADE
ncbi:MAG: GDSL-type esterase/lipase family protein [Eubacteriales bacterium]|nr:GDSL-type esterase/lipase family protein [Eubacteriales bacterium]